MPCETNLTHQPLEILLKTRFEARWAVFWSLSCYKELKLTTKPFTGRKLRGPLIQMQNLSLRSSGMRRKQNFYLIDWLLLFAFLASFFPFAEDLERFILVRNVLGNARRILGLEERKGRWVVEQDFTEIFRSMLHVFSPFSPVSLTESCLFWYGLKDLFTLHKLADNVSLDH